jgi:hypothetical protein
MQKPAFTQEALVTFRDFETLIRSMPAASKYSSQQLKSVFMTYAHGPSANEASMRTIDFKDKFFPGYHWQRQAAINTTSEIMEGGSVRGGGPRSMTGESDRTESMHVDNILAGIRKEELQKAPLSVADSKDGGKLLKVQEKYKVTSTSGGMHPIKEERLEVASQSSTTSHAIDDIITKGRDPRRNKFEPSGLAKIEEEKRGGKDNMGASGSLTQDDLRKFKQNQEFFR